MLKRVAVIGAGMAGAACAAALAEAGVAASVVDKGRSVGGRLAQRRIDGATFDHGAQYIGAHDDGFRTQLERWVEEGVAAPWDGVTTGGGAPTWIGVPGMNAPVKRLLDGLHVATVTRVTRLTREAGAWHVDTEAGDRSGPFDAVLLTVPQPQAIDLLRTVGEATQALVSDLASVVMAPCWSGLVAFAEPLGRDWTGRRVEHGTLAWIARNPSKQGRDGADCWTLHASPAWSREHLERSPAEVAPLLLDAFQAVIGSPLPTPAHLSAHRWRYSMVEAPLGEPCRWLPEHGLGVGGDWCLGPRVEAAWLSGRALAASVQG